MCNDVTTTAVDRQRAMHEQADAVRDTDCARNRTIMQIAKLDAHKGAWDWDDLPWRADDQDQSWFVLMAIGQIDALLNAGVIEFDDEQSAVAEVLEQQLQLADLEDDAISALLDRSGVPNVDEQRVPVGGALRVALLVAQRNQAVAEAAALRWKYEGL